MLFLKASGVWFARLILVLTGNLEVAAVLRALPLISSLPFRLIEVEDSYRLEFASGPEEWAEWRRQLGLDYPSRS